MTQRDSGSGQNRRWWKEAVVYQIYPRSFNDTDGDGVGDLPGIIEKVDYLDDLGVDVVWLCPVYDSPNADNGYDIRDYRSIMDEFGTMGDWEALLAALHDRDIKLIMDLVVNHTSDEHEWFRRSRERDAEYADYYHWVDGEPDEPPNNWESIFGGSAWTYDERRGEWYLHLFHETQPDLNWRNPRVREDVESMMRWWLKKGIDGFRMDAINLLSKAEGYPDGDPTAGLVGEERFFNGPRLEEYLSGLVDVLDEYDAMTVAEMPNTDVDTAARYLEDGAGLGMIFQSDHMDIDAGPDGIWDPTDWGDLDLPEFKRAMTRWQTGLRGRGWNSVFLGNHDQPRIVSRFGDDEAYRRESATLLATFLLTLSGTPYVYQGDEIGMTNDTFESLDEIDDVETIGSVTDLFERGVADGFEDVRDLVNYWSRDHARTPMQWSAAENAGFTDGDPWLLVNENYREINVETERDHENSIWHHYRRLIDLRGEEDALVYGEYDLLLPDHPSFYAYTRTLGDDELLVVLNWSDGRPTFEAGTVDTADAEVLARNYEEPPTDPAGREFRPYEAVVYRL
ncbi:glycoside hydrolase family 13 protein [Halorubrum sp. HHNYT27]|uniref:glycoside hydrolase family 13 protein n=1 Tax=Halorubrum sp. HHNYT27 TaxID=3402275 RepID=UPI003EBECC18